MGDNYLISKRNFVNVMVKTMQNKRLLNLFSIRDDLFIICEGDNLCLDNE